MTLKQAQKKAKSFGYRLEWLVGLEGLLDGFIKFHKVATPTLKVLWKDRKELK